MLPLRDELPTRRVPIVNYLLIATNILAFLALKFSVFWAGVAPTRVVLGYGLVPARFWSDPSGDAITVLTSMFMHDPTGWGHLAGNMLFLWIFGDNVEDAIGSFRYVFLYFGAGLLAALIQAAVLPGSLIPMVGASGAISGVLAAYGLLYPRSPITVLNPVLPLWLFFGPLLVLPAWLIIAEYFVGNLFRGVLTIGAREGGVAFFAHVGGFVGGALLLRVLRPNRNRDDYDKWSGWRSPPRARRIQVQRRW